MIRQVYIPVGFYPATLTKPIGIYTLEYITYTEENGVYLWTQERLREDR